MARIIFPKTTSPGEEFVEGNGRLINCYAEPKLNPSGSKDADYIIKRTPGARVFAEIDEDTFRGGVVVDSALYAAYDGTAVSVDDEGTETTIDDLSGTDRVFWAKNNNSTPDVVIVCEDGVFTTDGATISAFADSDVGAPNAVCFLGGYFFFTYGNGTCQASGINAVTIDTNDKVTAESNPDGLLRPVPWKEQLLLCGSTSIEVWSGNPVNDAGFPFNRVTVIQRGLIAAHAIAGFEDGFKDALIFVSDDNRVRQINNYSADAISPPDLDRLIERVADKTELEATVYKSGGHAFWQLSCTDWTWVYNVNTQRWHERRSYLQDRSRLTQAVYAFSKWIAGDTESGNLLEITGATAKEGADPLVVRVESLGVAKFPYRVRIPRADFEFATGVGSAVGVDPIETDPAVSISWSDNGGLNWSVPLIRKVGRQAKTTTVTIINAGQSGDVGRKWAVEMSDPVHFGLMGGEQSTQLGTK